MASETVQKRRGRECARCALVPLAAANWSCTTTLADRSEKVATRASSLETCSFCVFGVDRCVHCVHGLNILPKIGRENNAALGSRRNTRPCAPRSALSMKRVARCCRCGAVGVGIVAALIGVVLNIPSIRVPTVLVLDEWIDANMNATAWNTHENVYLRGAWEPVTEEHTALPIEVVHGRLPKTLSGVFLRIGPNSLIKPPQLSKRYHVFDGDGMVHSVRIQDGVAIYSNRWVKNARFNFEQQLGKAFFPRIGPL